MAEDLGITLDEFRENFSRALDQLGTVIIGHTKAREQLLVAIFAEGHVLLTGVPGLGRTLIGETLARILGLTSSRIQFTPDLLPTDILGAEVLHESEDKAVREFRFFRGPIFANLILADEINRSPARTQSALLEAMQEKQVTVGGNKYPVPLPFQLIATQNAVETEGIYPLPEAQMDRFMMMIELDYPDKDEEKEIVTATSGEGLPAPQQVLTAETVLKMQRIAKYIPVAPSVKDFALSMVRATRPGREETSEEISKMIRWGSSPRGGQCLLRGAKILAVVRGRNYVSREDIKDIAHPVLKHRLIPDYRTKAQGVSLDEVIDRLVEDTERMLVPKAASSRVRRMLKGELFQTAAAGPGLLEAASKRIRELRWK
jgi:MoxR-like ATPase